jgi:hypothetical protein
MKTKNWFRIVLCLVPGMAVFIAGCSSGDVDPDKVKVGDKGYYTGPMKSKSGAAGSEGK